MADTEQLPQLLFELFDAWTSVGEPSAVYHFTDSLQKAFLVADVRTTDVEGLFEARLGAEYGEIMDRFLCQHVSALCR
jgi:hypothetical protein